MLKVRIGDIRFSIRSEACLPDIVNSLSGFSKVQKSLKIRTHSNTQKANNSRLCLYARMDYANLSCLVRVFPTNFDVF